MKQSCTSSLLNLTAFLMAVCRTAGQGTFQDLDFESATVDQTQQPGFASVTDALPGWNVYYDTNQPAQIGFNNTSLGQTFVSLVGTNDPYNKTIEGGFSVLIIGGVIPTPGTGVLYPAAASIRQMGLVPASSASIMFKAQPVTVVQGGGPTIIMSLGGVSIPYFALSNGPNYTLYAANVSGFAGRTVELDFSLPGGAGSAFSAWNLDSIQFSDLAVPEPSAGILVALGMAVILLGQRKGRVQKAPAFIRSKIASGGQHLVSTWGRTTPA